MKSPQQVWEESYPDRRKWEALDQDTRDEWERVVRVAQEPAPLPDCMMLGMPGHLPCPLKK